MSLNPREKKAWMVGIGLGVASVAVSLGIGSAVHGEAPPAVPPSLPVAPGVDLVKAKADYASQCASCHGDHGEGAIGPKLAGTKLPLAQIESAIAKGVGSRMPAFKELGPTRTHALATYVLQELR